MTDEERIEELEEILEDIGGMAERLSRYCDMTGNNTIRYYVLPQFEGQNGGWMGTQAVDYLTKELEALKAGPADDEA